MPHGKLVIIAWSGELDKVWPQMILATTGAAMGMQTTIFFTFWGLFSLVKDEVRITGENWMQKMITVMDRPGMEHLKLGKMNFAGAGPAMMKHLGEGAQGREPQRAARDRPRARRPPRAVPDDDGSARAARART